MVYDVDYFIAKFEAIPASKWCISAYERDGKHCALGHCGVKNDGILTKEAALLKSVMPNFRIILNRKKRRMRYGS